MDNVYLGEMQTTDKEPFTFVVLAGNYNDAQKWVRAKYETKRYAARYRLRELPSVAGISECVTSDWLTSSLWYGLPWIEFVRETPTRSMTITVPDHVSQESAQACLNKNFPGA